MSGGKGVVFLSTDQNKHKMSKMVGLTDGSVFEIEASIGGFPFTSYYVPNQPKVPRENVLFLDDTVHGPLQALRVNEGPGFGPPRPVRLFRYPANNTPYTIAVRDDFLIFRQDGAAKDGSYEPWVAIHRKHKRLDTLAIYQVSHYSTSTLIVINTSLFLICSDTYIHVCLLGSKKTELVNTWHISLGKSDKLYVVGIVGAKLLVYIGDEFHYLDIFRR